MDLVKFNVYAMEIAYKGVFRLSIDWDFSGSHLSFSHEVFH